MWTISKCCLLNLRLVFVISNAFSNIEILFPFESLICYIYIIENSRIFNSNVLLIVFFSLRPLAWLESFACAFRTIKPGDFEQSLSVESVFKERVYYLCSHVHSHSGQKESKIQKYFLEFRHEFWIVIDVMTLLPLLSFQLWVVVVCVGVMEFVHYLVALRSKLDSCCGIEHSWAMSA